MPDFLPSGKPVQPQRRLLRQWRAQPNWRAQPQWRAQPKRRAQPNWPWQAWCGVSAAAAAGGYSLLDLLLYVSLSGLVLGLTVSLLLSSNATNNSLLRSLRLLDRWSRLSTLLESEIAEGMQISYGTTLSAACGGGSADVVVTVTIPYLTSQNLLSTTGISYFSRDRQLYRCGPTFLATGRLQPDQPLVVSQLANRLQFSVDTSASSSQDPARALRYSVQFLDADQAPLLSRSATVRTRVSPIQ